MDKKEKLQKMSAVKAFCRENGIEEKELEFLFKECAFATTPFPFDILYADGTVSKMPDLSKEAVAVKVTHHQGAFWLRMQTSYPQRMTGAEACRYVDELPVINGKKWRLPTFLELDIFFDRRSDVSFVVRLCRFFELPPLFMVGKDDPDGRFVLMRTDDGYSSCPFFPGLRTRLKDEDSEYCWPVLDV